MAVYERKDKDSIKIEVGEKVPISEEGKQQWPPRLRKKLKPANVFRQRIKVKVKEIDTKEKLANWVYLNFGIGKFSLFVYSKWVKNKKFNHYFNCMGSNCPKIRKCKVKNKNRKTLNCKMNPMFRPNQKKVASIIIKPSSVSEFSFKFTSNKMHRFWFWRG